MYWWEKAALLVKCGDVRRFGLITTNSLRQTFNRRVLQQHLGKLSLVYAVPDHPWVDTAEGAAVRIAMTVGTAGAQVGELFTSTVEEPHNDGSSLVSFSVQTGLIAADLTIGADLTSTVALKSNEGLTSMGVMLAGRGFVIEAEEAADLVKAHPEAVGCILRPLSNGKDLLDRSRGSWVIDFTGLSVEEARSRYPALFQLLLNRVKPERDGNRDAQFREKWWLFGRWRQEFRDMTRELPHYIAAVETAKHRVFHVLDASVLPEHSLIGFGLKDAFFFGVLSSRIHVVFALAAGGTLEDRPRYNKTRCFDPFPFPICDETTKARIRAVAEELDAHRKRVQADHGLTLTGLYNVLEKLRANQPLTDKEKTIHHKGLVSILKQLHDDLDAAVFAAYGWSDLAGTALRSGPANEPPLNSAKAPEDKDASILTPSAGPPGGRSLPVDAEILTRLVALNAERAAEEKRGLIRWLRPDYQNPKGTANQTTLGLKTAKKAATKKAKVSKAKTPWPKTLPERMRATEQALQAAASPVTAEELTKRFARANAAEVRELLETLVVMGKAHETENLFSI